MPIASSRISAVDKIQVLNGRYGPYISDGAKNARIPKDRDPKSLTLADCQSLLAAAPAAGTRGRFGRRPAAKGKSATAAASEAAVAKKPARARKAAAKKPAVDGTPAPAAAARRRARAAPATAAAALPRPPQRKAAAKKKVAGQSR